MSENESDKYQSPDLNFPRSHHFELSRGNIKSCSEDFYVEEIMNPELQGEGEHVWLWVEKQDQNTEYVAKQIAKFAGVRAMDVGLSGLKDRWAVTRQWFSVYMGNKPEPDWSLCEIEGVKLLKWARHVKKLRRGEHQSNRFRIVVRELNQPALVEPLLERIQKQGFPNYYGPQRFGFDGANLSRAALWFQGKIKASRSQRSFYLSAVRSYLFNLNLARLIRLELQPEKMLQSMGPLYGDPVEQVPALDEQEKALLEEHPILAQGIHKNRMKLERRAYWILPKDMSWCLDGDQLQLEFELPVGVFATSLLSEACLVADQQGGLKQDKG